MSPLTCWGLLHRRARHLRCKFLRPVKRIPNRDGLHALHSENSPEDDPRHDWTCDDCWKDAVALLGSEEAVRAYLEEPAKDVKPPERDRHRPKKGARSSHPRLFD